MRTTSTDTKKHAVPDRDCVFYFFRSFYRSTCQLLLQEVLLRFACDDGSFRHVLSDRNGDLMATEQCMYALAAVSRIERGESSLYRMQTETP